MRLNRLLKKLAGESACPTNAGVGRSPWTAADAPVGLRALFRLRVQGDPRGPGGPPHRFRRIRQLGRHPGLWVLLALWLAPAAHAQFDLFLVEGSTERAAPAVYDFGSLYADESASAHFRLRNTSNAAAAVNVLAVAGTGFTLTAPVLPVGLAPQAAFDFSVAFHGPNTGTYSASLHSESIAILLTATVAPRLTYRIDSGCATAFPGPVDFGSVVRGSSAACRITIQNDTPGVLTIPAISVQGADFALLGAAPSGQALQSRQGGEFSVVFTPPITGLFQGALTIGDRSYPLLGTGADPPLPKPIISRDLTQAGSAQQGGLIVWFDAPAQTSGTGTATLDFIGPPDPAIAFASGGRSATFPIAPGDVQAVLPFQTGTTAGVLIFTVQIGGASDQRIVTITPDPPGITTAQGVRSAGAVEVRIVGFDNTRSMGAISVTFYDVSGSPIAPGTIRTDASSAVTKYFAGSDLGGVFLLAAVYPVTGDVTRVASCDATLINSAGSSRTQRTTF